MKFKIYEATLIFSGNWSDDPAEAAEQKLFWESTKEILSEKNYQTDNAKIYITANWSRAAEGFDRSNELMNKLDKDESFGIKLLENKSVGEIFHSDILIPVTVKIEKGPEGKRTAVDELLKQYAFDIFLITNLAKPGICDFFSLRMEINPKERFHDERETLKLSGYTFEAMCDVAKHNKYPNIIEIPISDVARWIGQFDIGIKQQATNPVEQALFSILHVCYEQDASIASIIWITHALEALFKTVPGRGGKELERRIIFTLEPNSRQAKKLKTQINRLYGLRHSIVHGGFKTYHPQRNECFDKNVDEQVGEMYELISTGLAITFACVQKLITKNADGIKVEEVFNFSELPKIL